MKVLESRTLSSSTLMEGKALVGQRPWAPASADLTAMQTELQELEDGVFYSPAAHIVMRHMCLVLLMQELKARLLAKKKKLMRFRWQRPAGLALPRLSPGKPMMRRMA